jgi:HSP20 family molecular chaperone IbpA
MTSWDLFEDLRAAQEDMMAMARARAWRPGQQYDAGSTSPAWAPAVDISERKDAYLVEADLPGRQGRRRGDHLRRRPADDPG